MATNTHEYTRIKQRVLSLFASFVLRGQMFSGFPMTTFSTAPSPPTAKSASATSPPRPKACRPRTSPPGTHAGLRRRRSQKDFRSQDAVLRRRQAAKTSSSSPRNFRPCSPPACRSTARSAITSELTERKPSAPSSRRPPRPQRRQIAGREPGHASRLFLRSLRQYGQSRRGQR